MDRLTIEQLDRIEEKQNELLNRTWLIMEKVCPETIAELKKELEKDVKKD